MRPRLDRGGTAHNRLVGIQPTLRAPGDTLLLPALDNNRAQIRSAAFKIHPALMEVFTGGDVFTPARTSTAEIAFSLVRNGDLVFAVGAVNAADWNRHSDTHRAGPVQSSREARRHSGTWVEVLHARDGVAVGRWPTDRRG